MLPTKSPQEKRKQAIKAVGRYSGLAFQLFGACLCGVLLGRWLDARLAMTKPLFSVMLSIVFMLASLYSLYRALLRG
jgi:F0F1-type ATP synthase assembly protein I